MNCEIICIGTELLTGDTQNTNVGYISKELSLRGFSVHYHTAIGDNPQRLKELIDMACKRSDLIITTGGLGPTQDDLTKEVVADYFGLPLVQNMEITKLLESYFKKRKIKMTDNNLRQALIPEGTSILANSVGTAPGIFFNMPNSMIFLLPGPPSEMKAMFEGEVLPILEEKIQTKVISRYYHIVNMGESLVEDALMDLIANQTNPTIATYVKIGQVLIRLTANGSDETILNQKLDEVEKIIKERLGDYIFTESKDDLPLAVGKLLIENKKTIATAESCTAGLISSKLSLVSGISESLKMGFVTYSNEAKMVILQVDSNTLKNFGAVSEETCREMCENLKNISGCDFNVSVTGIAGPGGGSPEKPVGLVFIGLATKDKTIIKKYNFTGSRNTIQMRTVNAALDMVRKNLIKNKEGR